MVRYRITGTGTSMLEYGIICDGLNTANLAHTTAGRRELGRMHTSGAVTGTPSPEYGTSIYVSPETRERCGGSTRQAVLELL